MKQRVFLFLNLFALLALAHGANQTFAQKSEPSKTAAKPAASQSSQVAMTVTQIDFEGLKALVKKHAEEKRPLLVNFWATWCDPCREEFPELVRIDAEYRPKGLEFVTVSLDFLSEIKTGVPQFLSQMKATMPAYLLKTPNEDEAISFIAPDYRGGLPMTVLYDAGGKLSYSRMGIIKPEILKPEIEKVLTVENKATSSLR